MAIIFTFPALTCITLASFCCGVAFTVFILKRARRLARVLGLEG